MNQKKTAEDKKKANFVRHLGVASTVGINMVASTCVGFAIGYWLLDKYLNTTPWFTILFTILGIISGFRYLFRIATRQGDNGNSDESV